MGGPCAKKWRWCNLPSFPYIFSHLATAQQCKPHEELFHAIFFRKLANSFVGILIVRCIKNKDMSFDGGTVLRGSNFRKSFFGESRCLRCQKQGFQWRSFCYIQMRNISWSKMWSKHGKWHLYQRNALFPLQHMTLLYGDNSKRRYLTNVYSL